MLWERVGIVTHMLLEDLLTPSVTITAQSSNSLLSGGEMCVGCRDSQS